MFGTPQPSTRSWGRLAHDVFGTWIWFRPIKHDTIGTGVVAKSAGPPGFWQRDRSCDVPIVSSSLSIPLLRVCS